MKLESLVDKNNVENEIDDFLDRIKSERKLDKDVFLADLFEIVKNNISFENDIKDIAYDEINSFEFFDGDSIDKLDFSESIIEQYLNHSIFGSEEFSKNNLVAYQLENSKTFNEALETFNTLYKGDNIDFFSKFKSINAIAIENFIKDNFNDVVTKKDVEKFLEKNENIIIEYEDDYNKNNDYNL